MSFPKAKVKRFNEFDVCAGPPVGSYDPKLNDGTTTTMFLRSERFTHGSESLESSTSSIEFSAKKTTYFKKPCFPNRQSNTLMQAEYTKVQECEKEIRRLLKERSNLLKQLSSKEEEMKKLESKLQTVMRERSHFQANMATFEKEIKELQRANDILKMKVNTLEGVSKTKDLRVELANLRAAVIEKEHIIVDLKQELTSLRQDHEKCAHELNDKNIEINKVNDEMILAIKNLENELEHAKDQIVELEAQKNNLVDNNDEMSSQIHHMENKIAKYENMIRDLTQQKELLSESLKESCQDLEIKKQQISQIVEDFKSENLSLLSQFNEQTNRQHSQEKILSAELDNAYQKLDVTEDCSRALQEYRDVLVGRVTILKDCVNDLEAQQSIDKQTIKEIKKELMDVTLQLAKKEQSLLDADKKISLLNEAANELKSVQHQLQSMTEKCKCLQEELNCRETDYLMRVDKLEAEILVAKLSYEVGEQELVDLRHQLPELQSSLDREQCLCKELQAEIKLQKSDNCKTVNELNDELIRVGSECSIKEGEIARLKLDIVTHLTQIEDLTEQLKLQIEAKDKLIDLNKMHSLQFSDLEDKSEKAKLEKLELESALHSSNSLLASLQDATAAEKRTMEEEMANLRNENESMATEISKLLSKQSTLESQVNDSKTNLAIANDNVNKVLLENSELVSVLANKEVEANEFKSAINDYELKFTNSEMKKNTLEDSNKILEEQLNDLETKCANHIKLHEETKKELGQKNEIVDMLNAECETMQTMFSELYDEKNNIEMEFRNLSRQLFNATEALTSEQDKCIELKRKLSQEVSKVKTLNEKLKETDEKCSNLKINMGAMEEQKTMLEDLCQNLEKKIDESHHNMSTAQHEMEVELSNLSEHLEQVLKEKHETESMLLESNNAHQEELSHAFQEINNLTLLLESSKSQVADLQVEVDLLSSSFAEKQKTEAELRDNLLTSQTQIESLTKDREVKEATICSMKYATEKFEKDLQQAFEYKNLSSSLEEKLNCTTEELHKLKLDLGHSESQISTLRSEVNALNSCIEDKDQIIFKLSLNYNSLNEAMDALNNELTIKDETINLVNEECKILKESLELRYEDIAELKNVIETNHHLISNNRDNSIIEDLHNTAAELDSLYETCKGQQQVIQEIESEKDELKNRVKQLETEVETQSAQTQWLADREKKLLRELDIVEEDAKLKQQEYIRVLRETQKQYTQFESERNKQLKEIEGQQNEEMLQALTNEYENRAQLLSQHIEQLKKESLSWKLQFEDLQAKVAPFQEQLDAFEVERNMMMSKTNETLSDFQKLSKQYVTLLGHQNHKQKIQHVCKLKEEILSLKDEKTKLASENMKLKKQLQRRDDGSIPGSARKFDPSKAFKHPNKENDTSLREFPNNFRQF